MSKEKSGELAKKLKVLRAEAGYTQAQVASAIGVSQQMYSKFENSDTPLDSQRIRKLCELYGVSADYLLDIRLPEAEQGEKPVSFEESQIEQIVGQVLSRINDLKN